MAKQRLELDFKKNVLTHLPSTSWHMKIQTNSFAFKSTPADFIVLCEERYLVEAKQERNRYEYARLDRQKEALLNFEKTNNKNHSFVLVGFWNGSIASSSYYLIPITVMATHMDTTDRKTATESQFHQIFNQYKKTFEQMREVFT